MAHASSVRCEVALRPLKPVEGTILTVEVQQSEPRKKQKNLDDAVEAMKAALEGAKPFG